MGTRSSLLQLCRWSASHLTARICRELGKIVGVISPFQSLTQRSGRPLQNSSKRRRGFRAPSSYDKLLLAASNASVAKELKINPAVFSSTVCSLVRCCRMRLTHRAWRSDVFYGKVTILEQIGDYCL